MPNKTTLHVTAESDKGPLATQGARRDPIAMEGTPGRIAKFRTSTTIQDSIITESEGRIGIGTDTPTAKLTVTSPSGNAVVGVIGSGGGSNAAGVRGVSHGGATAGYGHSADGPRVLGFGGGPGVLGFSNRTANPTLLHLSRG
jgi:hypothetical protein